MLDTGAIYPNQSLWCNMVVLVHKKDGTLPFCIDFCYLNMHNKKDSCPLLHLQEALESMAGATHFSTMDFKSGFWQVKMAPDLQQYTAFTVGNLGFYEFTCMPFWPLQHASHPPAFDAKHAGRTKLDLLCHLSGCYDSVQPHQGRTLGVPPCSV